MSGVLAGRRIVVTRDRPGELASLLTARGATVVHVPLIEIAEPDDGGRELRAALAELDRYDWLIVTSAAGAERVGAAARAHRDVRLAAVGTATAATLAEHAGRPVELVPAIQIGVELGAEFVARSPAPQRVLVAHADRAKGDVVDILRRGGHSVTPVVAYRTLDRVPDRADRAAVEGADAVAFASGSAVESWVAAFGTSTPPVAVAIGPATATVAERLGLKLAGVATDHSLTGLVQELERQFASSSAAGW